MKIALQWFRSLIFIIVIYFAMIPFAIVFFPWALLSRKGSLKATQSWCGFTIWCARWMVGIHTEVRGTPPTGEVLVVGKHQSFLDIILIYHSVPHGRFIMKKELLWTPILGQYALGIGCIPIDRGKRGHTIRKMVKDVTAGRNDPGQLIIFPQGTRVPPREERPYKVGSGVLYSEFKQKVVPVACNVGLFWPGHGIMRRQGTAVIEFLDPIETGLPMQEFMQRLETQIEGASNALMDEAERTLWPNF